MLPFEKRQIGGEAGRRYVDHPHKPCKPGFQMTTAFPNDQLAGGGFAQLRAFVAAAQALSFSGAARALGVSPSALSQTIRALEARLGVRLFHRTTRSVSLTPAGEALLLRAKPALEELGAALSELRGGRERLSGVVRVLAFHSAAALYVAPVLADFHHAHPDVVVDLSVDDAVLDMVAGGFDVALRIGEVIEPDMVAVRLGPDLRQVAVASPEYLARHGRPEHPRDLTRHICIRWRWPGRSSPYRWEFFEGGVWFEVAVTGPLIVDSKPLAIRAALDGLGIAFAVEEQVAQALADGRLIPLLEAWCAPFPGHHLCYPRQRLMAPGVRAFIDHVRSAATRTSSHLQ